MKTSLKHHILQGFYHPMTNQGIGLSIAARQLIRIRNHNGPLHQAVIIRLLDLIYRHLNTILDRIDFCASPREIQNVS